MLRRLAGTRSLKTLQLSQQAIALRPTWIEAASNSSSSLQQKPLSTSSSVHAVKTAREKQSREFDQVCTSLVTVAASLAEDFPLSQVMKYVNAREKTLDVHLLQHNLRQLQALCSAGEGKKPDQEGPLFD